MKCIHYLPQPKSPWEEKISSISLCLLMAIYTSLQQTYCQNSTSAARFPFMARWIGQIKLWEDILWISRMRAHNAYSQGSNVLCALSSMIICYLCVCVSVCLSVCLHLLASSAKTKITWPFKRCIILLVWTWARLFPLPPLVSFLWLWTMVCLCHQHVGTVQLLLTNTVRQRHKLREGEKPHTSCLLIWSFLHCYPFAALLAEHTCIP